MSARAVNKGMQGSLWDASPRKVAVGIDQSYSGFGFAAVSTEGDLDHGCALLKGTGEGAARLVGIRLELDNLVSSLLMAGHEITAVAMEGYANGAKFGRELAGELGGMVKTYLFESLPFVPVHVVPPTRLKKYVTGKGTGVQKNQMLLQVYKKWGVEFHDDNLADAFSLAHLASGRALLSYEREVYSQLQ